MHCDDDDLRGGNRENLHSRLAQSLTLRQGDWRLVGAWNDPLASAGIHMEDRMAAVFIRVDFQLCAPSGRPTLRQMLENHGDALVGDIKRENLPLKGPENIWMDPFASDIPAPDSAPRPKVFFETGLQVDLGFPQGTPDADSARAQARHFDGHRLRLSTNFFLQPGETRLVGNWSPPPPEDGTSPDSMHALFVRRDMWEPAR